MITAFLTSLSANAILFTGLTGASIALWAILSRRATVRRQLTITMLQEKLWDGDYIEKSDRFYSLLSDQTLVSKQLDGFERAQLLKRSGTFANEPDDTKRELQAAIDDVRTIRTILNDRELIAIGIREGIYDDAIFKRYWYSTLLKERDAAELFIMRTKRLVEPDQRSRVYIEFQELAARWEEAGPYKRNRRSFKLPFIGRVSVERSN